MRNQAHERLIAPAPGATRQQQNPDDGASPARQPRPRTIPPRERARRPQVTNVACTPCRRRKTKCCGRRPICVSCEEKQSECSYAVEEGQTRQGSLKRSNEALYSELDSYKHVMVMLQTASTAEVSEILQRIRSTNDISETVQLIQASSLLLQQDPAPLTSASSDQSQQSPVSATPQQLPNHTDNASRQQQSEDHRKNPMDLHNMMLNDDIEAMNIDSFALPNKKQHTTEQYEQQQEQQSYPEAIEFYSLDRSTAASAPSSTHPAILLRQQSSSDYSLSTQSSNHTPP